jgi:pSer/pThr/pTyr-binding forkhead associated (FHA) protein
MAHPVPSGRSGPLASFALMAGPRYGEELTVPLPTVILGRAAGCDVQIDDDSVSAEHARLEYDGGRWRITDLDSTNGTAVEGVRLAPQLPTPLSYGASVRLGGVKLQFREVEAADVEAARAEYVPPAAPRTLREERSGARFPLWMVLLILVILVVVGIIVYMNVLAPTAVGAAPFRLPPLALAAP